MECATEVMPMSVGGMAVSTTRCTPSPQPGDKAYEGEIAAVESPQTAIHGSACVDTTPAVHMTTGPQQQTAIHPMHHHHQTMPQYYTQQYYTHQYAPSTGTPQYSTPALMYMPVSHATYYQHVRQQQQTQAMQQIQHLQHPQQHAAYTPQLEYSPATTPLIHSGTATTAQTGMGSKAPVVEPPTIVKTPSRQRVVIWNYCQFCQNNREPEEFFRGHILRDADGKVVCPVLRAYNCPICNNGGGDKAHTKSYCPQLRTSRMPPRRTPLFH